jgi:adenylate cyclase
MQDFIRQLKARGVIKVGIAYLVGGWLVMQLADVVFPALNLPGYAITLVLAIIVVGFPLAMILAWAFDLTAGGIVRAAGDMPAESAESSPAAAAERGPSIAVLPFTDMSAEKDQEHFCDGLTEELLNVLTRIPNLRVGSRTSSFSLKGKDIDLRSAAEQLNVAHILEGSVRKAGTRIRVTAQLIEVETDSHLWSENYDRELDDIFAIQDDIARHILEALKCRLVPEHLSVPTTDNPKAYEYFLRGLGYALTAAERDIQLAVEMFQKATAADPGFLRAWISLAEQASTIAGFLSTDEKWRRIADEAAEKAVQLAPDSAQSLLARAHSHAASRRYDEAERVLKKVIELDPTNSNAYHHLGRAQFHQGHIEDALENFALATEHDPNDYESPLISTSAYRAIGDEDGARRAAEIGVERAERILQDYPDNQRAYYLGSSGLYVLGQHDRAWEWTERALKLKPNDPATRYNSACFFCKYGELDRALDCLENSVVSRTWVENDPDLDPIRDHPRYHAILAQLSG